MHQIKICYILIFFSSLSIYAQTDTTSSLDILLQNSQHKRLEKEHDNRILGCSVFGGLGLGGNDRKTGFAQGISARVHYNAHTINIYTSFANKAEQIANVGYTNSLNSTCTGITYGVGSYSKYTSASIGAGLGYCHTLQYQLIKGPVYVSKVPTNNMVLSPYTPGFVNYHQFGICVGGQINFHYKFIGFTIQSFVNISPVLINYTALAGLELMLNDLIKTQKIN
jgi:hypothetical protein